jgi:hypothetical protein
VHTTMLWRFGVFFDCHKMVAHPANVTEGADRLGRISQTVPSRADDAHCHDREPPYVRPIGNFSKYHYMLDHTITHIVYVSGS